MRRAWLAAAGTGLVVAVGLVVRAAGRRTSVEALGAERRRIAALEAERDRLAVDLAAARAKLADLADLRRRMDQLAGEMMGRGGPAR